ncbi:helix-turn-helix domain-containing protein [Aeromicrobium sp.]|uniref:GlxA family transcriptional regulator n=1 Tax=Aeromicrobium sp. TaxID=1871063 RepID=UPI0030BCA878
MKKVVVIVQDGVEPFGLGVLGEVWAEPYHPEDDNPLFDYVVCTPNPGRVKGTAGYDYFIDRGLDELDDADLVAIVPKRDFLEPSPEVAAAVRAAAGRGVRVLASCTSVFILGEAGLLDGRECTTHWRYGGLLAERFPLAKVNADVLYVEDDLVLTGAGSAAAIDASLHLVRQVFGAKVATTTARRIVVAPHRDGGQAQFVRTPMGQTEADTLAPLLAWASDHLDEQLSVERLAAHAHMSPRTFARRFRDETGTTPLQWLTSQRLAQAEELLENSSLPVEQIAGRVGFGNAATLRHHFSIARGTTPQQYRKTFTCVAEAG